MMYKLEHVYKLHRLLHGRRTVLSRAALEAELEIPRSTLTRLLKLCQDRLGMPVVFDRARGGYCYQLQDGEHYELPGLWFNSSELVALLTSHRLLSAVQPGVLKPFIDPLQQGIADLLEHKHAGSKDVWERIKILPVANREARLEDFQRCADALVARKRLRILYRSRSKPDESDFEREVSPQRLIYYRDNWYLDAWCHKRRALRTFALDRMNVLDAGETALDVDSAKLDRHLTSAYGIFAGEASKKAVLHFSSHAAEWVAQELWHPQQVSQHLGDGRWELVVPYHNPTELIMDILKYGPEVEVVAPEALREAVKEKLSQTLRLYRGLRSAGGTGQ
jgi:proteasome accessory factor C